MFLSGFHLVLVLSWILCATRGQLMTRFCNDRTVIKVTSDCTSCAASVKMGCPNISSKITSGMGNRGCSYTVDLGGLTLSLQGCSHTCQAVILKPACCKGFWGTTCTECPGGKKACGGHGLCQDGISGNGTCICKEGFRGHACQDCADENLYGPNCDSVCDCQHGVCKSGISGDGSCICETGYTGPKCDQESSSCKSLACGPNSRCLMTSGRLACACMPGYSRTKGLCQPQNPCKPSPCSIFATCTNGGPRKFTCTCKEGYFGDGKICSPVNPCSLNYGGCPENSTKCVYRTPGKSYCSCKPGMIQKKASTECYAPSACGLQSCDSSAQCQPTPAGKSLCVCEDWEIGDGRRCYGTILNQIVMLNKNIPQVRKLTGALRILEEGCALTLRKFGPFTVFVPYTKLRNVNETWARQLCKLHIVPGQHLASDLKQRKLWTLSGEFLVFNQKEFSLGSRPDIKYRIQTTDLPASNGIIHIINNLIENGRTEASETRQKTIGDILANNEEFSRFETLLENCDLPPILNQHGSFTVFVPSNEAIDALRDGRLIYLLTKAKHKLLELVKYHISSVAAISADRLITMPTILTTANEIIKLNVTEDGRITLGVSSVPIGRTDIVASNGIIHTLDGILIPDTILPILPHQCMETFQKTITGLCSNCDSIAPCPDNSTDLGSVDKGCKLGEGTNSSFGSIGCARNCTVTASELGCCSGFYGPECRQCPGGFSSACYGRGTCNDGIHGNGKCICFPKFKGIACHICTDPNKHGNECDEDCRCLHGICDNRSGSRGVCQGGRCNEGFTGEFCDQRAEPCGTSDLALFCHLNATCETEGNITRCTCENGYEGDGFSCRLVDACRRPDRGGCADNAICTSAKDGTVSCECNTGWTGDGTVCLPIDNCVLANRGGCHLDAQCNFIQPGQNDCTCKRGYVGDGYSCDPVDLCLENNGGCHGMAKCQFVAAGKRTCTCLDGFGGDGLTCYGDIMVEMHERPELSLFNQWIMNSQTVIPKGDNITAVVPSNEAIEALPEKQKAFWVVPYMLPFLVRGHFIQGRFNSSQLCEHTGQEIASLQPRTKWEIMCINGSILIDNTSVISHDIPATNGFIFIINKVLRPPIGNIPPALPKLAQVLKQVPAFAKFSEALQESGLIQEIESSREKFTIFVPGNWAVEKFCNDSGIEHLRDNSKIMKYHVLLGEKMFPADFKSGIHKESMLGPSFRLTFYQQNNQTSIHNVPLEGTFYETWNGMLVGISRVLPILQNHCDVTRSHVTKSKCTSCLTGLLCPTGTNMEKTEQMCKYKRGTRNVSGCKFNCVSSYVVSECCKGYYGHQCLMCPGAPNDLCSGNGDCHDGLAGSGDCICQEGFHGTACEMCEPGRYGTDCKSECECVHGRCNNGFYGDGKCLCDKGWSGYTCERNITNDMCNGTCSLDANCVVGATNSTPVCSCIAGFTGNGTHCTEINVCAMNNGGCSEYAKCTRVIPGVVQCTCHEGYNGDGRVCIENDACLQNNGGCHAKAECTKTGPNKVACNCLEGYEGDGILRCTEINLCKENNGGCSPLAFCFRMGPGKRRCYCPGMYFGDGFTCRGNIDKELSMNPDTAVFYKYLKAQNIPIGSDMSNITVFAPVNQAFANNTVLEEYKSNGRLTDLLLEHVVDCRAMSLADLKETQYLTTLGGGRLRILIDQDNVYLNGRVNLMNNSIVAMNGIIHFIDEILVPEVQNVSHRPVKPKELNITEAAKIYGYSMFLQLLKDSKLMPLVSDKSNQPYTMLWPTDRAFNSLPEERKNWLYHEEHRDKLQAYLKIHMIRVEKISASKLPRQQRAVQTMHGSIIKFECSREMIGDIVVRGAKIVQRDMEFNIGIAHGIDQLLEPPNIGARCDAFVKTEMKASHNCDSCGFESNCPYGTTDTGKVERCSRRYLNSYSLWTHSRYSSSYNPYLSGCVRKCISVLWRPRCCKNHHGRDCQACPGGLKGPCSRHGECSDGLAGTGQCKCHPGFNGTACELCESGRYGVNCTGCACSRNGQCNDGVSGDGSCFCDEGWTGPNCEIKLKVKAVCSPQCDAQATCRSNNSCECNPHYEGDGRNCTVIDQCAQENGGCSSHAQCVQVGIVASCRCLSGYEGDGFFCSPIDLCANGNNGECSLQATCINMGPNIRTCQCHDGYVGNGIQCLEKAIPPVDRCLEQNGNCHSLAACTDLHYQEKKVGVFHLRSPKGTYRLTYPEAEKACAAQGATLATFNQLSAAQQLGMHMCAVGWLHNWTAGYPIVYPNPYCGNNHVGIVDYKQRTNRSETWDAFCFRVQDVQCSCPDRYVGDGSYCNGNLLEVLESTPHCFIFYSMLLEYANATQEGTEFLGFLSNATSYKTFFVPVDAGFNTNTTLSWRDLEHHVSQMDIMLGYENLTDGSFIPSKIGSNLSISENSSGRCEQYQCSKLVNNQVIIQWDIPSFNGIIHLIKGPLKAPLLPEESIGGISNPMAVGLVAALVVSLMVVAFSAGGFYYRQQSKGFQFSYFKADTEEGSGGEKKNVALVSIPNPMYGDGSLFEPLEDESDDGEASDTCQILGTK
ncbi:stabilin-1-like [Xenopus laevis]|uniref:Stabilin-1-like n=1 Tax=Xenopus laevis TaxID=8355 RepID=A0A8J1N148_XENLA|nr:stabilin-1-like [Xenopus laevis]